MTFEAPHVRKPRMRELRDTGTFVCQDLQGRAIGFGETREEAYRSWKKQADYMQRVYDLVQR